MKTPTSLTNIDKINFIFDIKKDPIWTEEVKIC